MNKFVGTVLFVIYTLVLAWLIDVLIIWVLNAFILDLLNWFNRQNFILQLALIIIGGTILIYLIFGLIQGLFIMATQPIVNKLPITTFTATFAFIICLLNSAHLIYTLWSVIDRFSFIVTLEFIMFSLIFISLNWSILLSRRKTVPQRLLSPEEINKIYR